MYTTTGSNTTDITTLFGAGVGTNQGNDYVSYAVINTGSTANTVALLTNLFGAANVKTMYGSLSAVNQDYVYLYEVVNQSQKSLGSFALQDNTSLFGAAGQISNAAANGNGAVFKNIDGSLVGPNTNQWSGPSSSTPSTADYANGQSGTTFITSVDGTTDPTQLVYQFQPDLLLANGGYTTIMFATSTNGPVTGSGAIQDSRYGGDGDVPVPAATPEPTSMAMMGLGVFGLGGWAGWRRRFRKLS
jgi:hypothetical protein